MATFDPFLGGGALLASDIKLNGQNYQDCASSVCMMLQLIGLASHLIEDRLPLHEIDHVGARAWQVAGDRVMGALHECRGLDSSTIH